MPNGWELELHHIDVGVGDATLLIVKQNGAIKRTALIDAGEGKSGPVVLQYIRDQQVKKLDVVICSHYDKDHLNGLVPILKDDICDGALIFDAGVPQYTRGRVDSYRNAANHKSGDAAKRRVRVTEFVGGQYAKPILPDKAEESAVQIGDSKKRKWEMSEQRVKSRKRLVAVNWLVGEEVLWFDAAQAERPDVDELTGWKVTPDPGAPTLTCVAANSCVLGHDQLVDTRGQLNDNFQSLAFLLEFGHFKYLTHGDCEVPVERGLYKYSLGAVNERGEIQECQHVCAFKVSHHGSDTATDPEFVAAIRPRAALISCGYYNKHGNPTVNTLQTLENAQTIENYFLTGSHDRQNYVRQPDKSDTDQRNRRGRVAGRMPKENDLNDGGVAGDIVLLIDEAEAAAQPHHFRVKYFDAGWKEPLDQEPGREVTIDFNCGLR